MDDDAIDARLRALLVQPEPRYDPVFVTRIERAARAEQAFRAARATAWRRFAGEAVASIAVTGVFAWLWRATPAGPDPKALTFGPAAAALMLALWFLTVMRPAATER